MNKRILSLALALTLSLALALVPAALAAGQTVSNYRYTLTNVIDSKTGFFLEDEDNEDSRTSHTTCYVSEGAILSFINGDINDDDDTYYDNIPYVQVDSFTNPTVNSYGELQYKADGGEEYLEYSANEKAQLPLKMNTHYFFFTRATGYTNIFVVDSNIAAQLSGNTTAPSNPLDTASDWAREGITSAIAKGFVPADLQNDYKNVITRAEFCRMAVKWVEYATGKSIDTVLSERGLTRDANAFSDTTEPNILAAFALGITSGTGNNQFTPDGQFNRQQAATMIMNTCRAIGADVSNPAPSGFGDMSTAASWAVAGIDYVRASGIMQGTGGNNFSPLSTYTREQSVITFDNINASALLSQ